MTGVSADDPQTRQVVRCIKCISMASTTNLKANLRHRQLPPHVLSASKTHSSLFPMKLSTVQRWSLLRSAGESLRCDLSRWRNKTADPFAISHRPPRMHPDHRLLKPTGRSGTFRGRGGCRPHRWPAPASPLKEPQLLLIPSTHGEKS